MDIKKVLINISGYLSSTRRVGHTSVMEHGALSADRVVVVANNVSMRGLLKASLPNATVITLDQIQGSALQGRGDALAVDNAALMSICSEAALKIEQLEGEIERLKGEHHE